MTPAEALVDVRGYASAHRIRIGTHARQRMAERGVVYRDLQHALANASRCTKDADKADRWRVDGRDPDGDDLSVIVVLEGGVVVVTVF